MIIYFYDTVADLGQMVVLWVVLPPHSSRVPSSVLSITVCVELGMFSTWVSSPCFWFSSTNQKYATRWIRLYCR